MRRIVPALVLFTAIMIAAPAGLNNHPAANFDRVREFIKQQLSERHLPSIAVAGARTLVPRWRAEFRRGGRRRVIHWRPFDMSEYPKVYG